MANAHDRLRRLIRGKSQGRRSLHWHHVMGLLHDVCGKRTAESERILREVALFQGRLTLNPSRGLPHALPPEEVLRSVAVQTLGRWDRARHRDVLQQVAAEAEWTEVRTLALAHLS